MTEEIDLTPILDKIGMFVKEQAIRYCPVDNGFLHQASNFEYEVDSKNNSVTVTCTSPIAGFVEYGTGVFHLGADYKPDPRSGWDIEAKNAKVLRFEVGRKERLAAHKGPATANIVYAKKVHIEGAQPQPFMRPAVYNHIGDIQRIIKEGIAK